MIDISYPFGARDQYRSIYVNCNRHNQIPCDLGVKDFFPNHVSFTSSNLHHSVEGRMINDTDFHLPSGILHVGVRHFYGACVGNVGSSSIKDISVDTKVKAIDVSYSSVLDCYGWYEQDSDSAIYGLSSLQYLDVSHIGFKSLPPLKDLVNLRTLNCSYNRLGYYDHGQPNKWKLESELFWGKELLEILDLSGNELKKVPINILEAHPRLEELSLSGNRIESSNLFFKVPSNNTLRLLDLSSNSLSFVNPPLLTEITKHSNPQLTLDLSNNPFLCVCELQPLVQWLQETTIDIVNKKDYQCSIKTDSDVLMMNLINMDSSILCPFSSLTIALSAIGSTLLFSSLLAALSCKYRLHIIITFWMVNGSSAVRETRRNHHIIM